MTHSPNTTIVAVFEDDMPEPDTYDGGMALVAQFDDLGDPDEGLFLRLQSWSERKKHPEMDSLRGKRIRITVAVIGPVMEPRAMHTKDLLAGELRAAGLPEMAAQAERGHYHDFLSELETPCQQLVNDLRQAGTPAALALCARAIAGAFDASQEESDAWAASVDRLCQRNGKPGP